MNDLRTVLWKEWRELRAQSGDLGPRTTAVLITILLGIVAAMGVVTGEFLVRTPILLLISWTPVLGILGVAAEAFAGERERHTLETLLASRLRTEALLLGKLLLLVLYGYGATLLLAAILLAGANAKSFPEKWTWPTAPVMVLLLLVTPLAIFFLSALGALVSLRAATVRQAQSRLIVTFVLIFVVLVAIGNLGPKIAPAEATAFVRSTRGQMIIVGSWAILLGVADLCLLLLAWTRFQRDRLIEIR